MCLPDRSAQKTSSQSARQSGASRPVIAPQTLSCLPVDRNASRPFPSSWKLVSPRRNTLCWTKCVIPQIDNDQKNEPADSNGERPGVTRVGSGGWAAGGETDFLLTKWTLRKRWPCLPARCAGIVPLAPAYEAFAAACACVRACVRGETLRPRNAGLTEYRRYTTFYCQLRAIL